MKRTLADFFEHELHFEHLRTIYRHYLGSGGYERAEMVDGLSAYLSGKEGKARLAEELGDEEAELLYVLRQVGGIAPQRWLYREMAKRNGTETGPWRARFRDLCRRHVTFRIGRETAYLPEGISDVYGKRITRQPRKLDKDIVLGASAIRQSVHGLVVALLGHIHQTPPRIMAEEERIWKRDLEGMADFFHGYLFEAGAGQGSIGQIRGRVSRLVELLRKMGFLEKRGKRLYIDPDNWSDWSARSEVERQSLFLSFLRDHYENIPVALEALVDWKDAGWIPLDRLTEAVRYRTLRSTFHVLRIRPQTEVTARDPGKRWVFACVHLLADLGLVYTGSDSNGESVARATDSGLEAWRRLHTAHARRRRHKEVDAPRAYAQPNFELLIPEECPPRLHRRIAAIAELKSLDRFWTYVLTPQSVARGVEEGLTSTEALRTLDDLVDGELPPNVREAVNGWAETAWWVAADGNGALLQAETGLFRTLVTVDGLEEHFEVAEDALRPRVPRHDAERWLEERGIRVVEEDRDPPGELGRSVREVYTRAVEAWHRRLEHGGEGTPVGSYWDDVVPVEPFSERSDA
ncbi:MAG: hypothetical protein HKN12_01655 [Gemmatimonadetes bacterium]|nr:hypothetical protein [Gemmatimonadota bacterium]